MKDFMQKKRSNDAKRQAENQKRRKINQNPLKTEKVNAYMKELMQKKRVDDAKRQAENQKRRKR